MKTNLIAIALALVLITVAGCAFYEEAKDKVVTITAKVVTEYCKGSPQLRAAIRAEFAPAFLPNKVTIDCAEES